VKKIAILVIAATNLPVYVHYIKSYWTEAIRYTNAHVPGMDIFLLFEPEWNVDDFDDLSDNIIVDRTRNYDELCDPAHQSWSIPGILSKTIDALERLHTRYDVFFRTNLSSVLKLASFDQFVQSKPDMCYSGDGVWVDALREDLLFHDRVGEGRSIRSLSELDGYPGNTFVTGAGYFLSSSEAAGLVRRKGIIRYDIIDDVSVGLMLERHEALHGFSVTLLPETPVSESVHLLRDSTACHARLQGFPLGRAEALWDELRAMEAWRL
jgi:hypothetical protein